MIVAFGLGQPCEYAGIVKYQSANSKTIGPGYVQFVVVIWGFKQWFADNSSNDLESLHERQGLRPFDNFRNFDSY